MGNEILGGLQHLIGLDLPFKRDLNPLSYYAEGNLYDLIRLEESVSYAFVMPLLATMQPKLSSRVANKLFLLEATEALWSAGFLTEHHSLEIFGRRTLLRGSF